MSTLAEAVPANPNVIFLSIGEVHRIEFEGNTVELTTPECGENGLDIP